ncbi:unnamed protein product [Bursaphelenchus xylophilus]|uniref:(pine wood nematode) hypothetical protein n=1 Tax=Bursaphelenchus xylophilus TaxID=6326 RepID=A0A811LNM9_BURXY|nr:unnamed protein product [Bursaphelenchus xylophilus]CAG9122440.1 unnamed protein product [Bursaphelenchus xylophilus]
MLVLLLLAVLAAVSVVFGLLLKQLGRCLKRRRRKALARTFNRSPEAGSTAPLFQFSPRMSSGQFNLGSTLGNSFRCGGQRFPTIQVVGKRFWVTLIVVQSPEIANEERKNYWTTRNCDCRQRFFI